LLNIYKKSQFLRAFFCSFLSQIKYLMTRHKNNQKRVSIFCNVRTDTAYHDQSKIVILNNVYQHHSILQRSNRTTSGMSNLSFFPTIRSILTRYYSDPPSIFIYRYYMGIGQPKSADELLYCS
jgi:hypothetical protein